MLTTSVHMEKQSEIIKLKVVDIFVPFNRGCEKQNVSVNLLLNISLG